MTRFDDQFETSAAGSLDLEFSVSVFFVRGSNRSAAFECSFDNITDETVGTDDLIRREHRRRWYVETTDLNFGDDDDVAIRVGDHLVEEVSEQVHEVLPEGDAPGSAGHVSGDRFIVLTKQVA